VIFGTTSAYLSVIKTGSPKERYVSERIE